jgi:hypothetical protein
MNNLLFAASDSELTAFDAAGYSIGLVVALACLLLIPKLWRPGGWVEHEEGVRGTFGSGPFQRAFIRDSPAGVVTAIVAMLGVLSDRASNGLSEGWVVGVLHATSSVCGILFGLLLLLHIGIVFLNRPKWAVPPAYREQRGVLMEWFGGGRSRPEPDAKDH